MDVTKFKISLQKSKFIFEKLEILEFRNFGSTLYSFAPGSAFVS